MKSAKVRITFSIQLTLALAAALAGSAVQADDGRFETDYDRNSQGTERLKPWESQAQNGESQSVSGIGTENSAGTISGESLASSYDRISQDPAYIAVRDTVDDHTQRLDDLEDVILQLETATTWQEQPPVEGAWTPMAGGASGVAWEPAITTQEADFTQTRTITAQFQRTVEIYEENPSTGERRLADSYTETETRTETQSRVIDVARSAFGGADGWSATYPSGPKYNCGSWGPSTSSVMRDIEFNQTQPCDQDFVQSIYYLADGAVVAQRDRPATCSFFCFFNTDNTRTALGTGTRLAGGQCYWSGSTTSGTPSSGLAAVTPFGGGVTSNMYFLGKAVPKSFISQSGRYSTSRWRSSDTGLTLTVGPYKGTTGTACFGCGSTNYYEMCVSGQSYGYWAYKRSASTSDQSDLPRTVSGTGEDCYDVGLEALNSTRTQVYECRSR